MKLGPAGGALLGCLWLGCDDGGRSGPHRTPPQSPATLPIEPPRAGWSREVRVGAGQAQRFSIPLRRGDFLHLVAEQRGTDSVIRVLQPSGQVLITVDRPRDVDKPEELFWLAPADRRYLIEIAAWDDAQRAPVAVRIAELRRATAADRLRAGALAAFAQGGRAEKEAGRRAEAIAAYRKAARLWRQAGDALREGWAWDQEGRLEIGSPDLARVRSGAESLERAAALYTRAGEAALQATALGRLGEGRERLGDLAAAANGHERALALEQAAGNFANQAARSNALALIYLRQGRLAEAFDRLNRSKEINQDLKDRENLAKVLFNRGALYAAVGQPRRALVDHLRALELVDGNAAGTKLRAAILTKVGDDLLDLGRPDEALARYRQALGLRRQAVDAHGVAVTLNGIGLAELAKNRPGRALEPLREAATIFRLQGRMASRAVVLNHLGRAYERLGATDRGREQFDRALATAPENPFQGIAENAWFGQARLARRAGRLADAERLMESALKAGEELGRSLGRTDFSASLLSSRREHFEFLVDLLAERHRREPRAGHDGRAFSLHERLEAQSLYGLLGAGRATLDAAGAERLRRLARRINALDRGLMRRESGGSLESSPPEQALAGLLHEVRRIEMAGPLPPLPAEGLDLARVQELMLDDQTLLLEFHLGAERSFLWAVTRSARRLVVLPPREEIERVARQVDRLLPESRFEIREIAAGQAVAQLSRMVLGSVADLLDKRRLVVVASGVLGRVPFSALPHPHERTSAPEPLLVDHDVVQLPSIAVLAALRAARRGRPPARHLLALVADPVFSLRDPRIDRHGGRPGLGASAGDEEGPETFARLQYTGGEAKAIEALAPPGTAFVATGPAASRELVESGRLADFRILHFATHGLYKEEFPELSALALSSLDAAGRPVDGLLRAYEVVRLDLRADLVVLSACRTALGGGDGRGAGQRGLTEAFLQAGVPRVLVALWDVDDRATGELMRRFYRGLLVEGLPPARALRQAQLSLRRQPRWRAPFYWAGFVLQGDWT